MAYIREAIQRDVIRKHFKRGLSLNQRQAFQLYDCLRLPAVVWYLRHKEMMPIGRTMVYDKTRKKVYARYELSIILQLN